MKACRYLQSGPDPKPDQTDLRMLQVRGIRKYKLGVGDVHGFFRIYFADSCFWIVLTWDMFVLIWLNGSCGVILWEEKGGLGGMYNTGSILSRQLK